MQTLLACVRVAARRYRVPFLPCAAASAALILLWPPLAAAEGPGFTLDWQSEPACDGGGVRRGVERLLGAPLDEAPSSPLHARAQLRGKRGGWRVTIDVVQGTLRSSRTVEVASCAEAVGTTALVLALAIDPEVGSHVEAGALPTTARFNEPSESSPEPGPAPSSRARSARHTRASGPGLPQSVSRATDAASSTAGERPSRWPITGFVSTLGALAFGPLPGIAPGLALGAGLHAGGLRLSALGTQYLERTAEAENTTGWLTVELATLDLRAGWRLQPGGRWEFVPTASIELGQFSGSGQNVDFKETPRFAWGAAGLGGTLEFRLARSWLVVGQADALVPFRRTQFTVNHQTLHRPAQVEGVVRIGIAYEFGKRP
jgi:hypothetical protein